MKKKSSRNGGPMNPELQYYLISHFLQGLFPNAFIEDIDIDSDLRMPENYLTNIENFTDR